MVGVDLLGQESHPFVSGLGVLVGRVVDLGDRRGCSVPARKVCLGRRCRGFLSVFLVIGWSSFVKLQGGVFARPLLVLFPHFPFPFVQETAQAPPSGIIIAVDGFSRGHNLLEQTAVGSRKPAPINLGRSLGGLERLAVLAARRARFLGRGWRRFRISSLGGGAMRQKWRMASLGGR
jgi:hypothetical protein